MRGPCVKHRSRCASVAPRIRVASLALRGAELRTCGMRRPVASAEAAPACACAPGAVREPHPGPLPPEARPKASPTKGRVKPVARTRLLRGRRANPCKTPRVFVLTFEHLLWRRHSRYCAWIWHGRRRRPRHVLWVPTEAVASEGPTARGTERQGPVLKVRTNSEPSRNTPKR